MYRDLLGNIDVERSVASDCRSTYHRNQGQQQTAPERQPNRVLVNNPGDMDPHSTIPTYHPDLSPHAQSTQSDQPTSNGIRRARLAACQISRPAVAREQHLEPYASHHRRQTLNETAGV
ncbi:hypothetical protein D3C84_946710 [compost metagenome]